MKKKHFALWCILIITNFSLFACNKKETKETTNGDITQVSKKDLNNYISGINIKYVLLGSQSGTFLNQISYDSEVITDIEIDDSEVNTKVSGEYSITYIITVDTDALCKKENKNNLTKGDTSKITVETTVEVIDKAYAQTLTENGGIVIGYDK